MRTALVLIIISIAGFYAFSYQTNGFNVVTTESARRQNIQQNPIDLDDVVLLDARNNTGAFIENIKNDGRTAIINFIYTRCADICVSMGIEFQQLQKLIIKKNLNDKVRLISISFDERDNAKWLHNYSQRMQLDPNTWQVFLARDSSTRKQLLQQFGIVVVPAPLGQFEHNAAYHIVSPHAQLSNIIDLGLPELALSKALTQSLEQ